MHMSDLSLWSYFYLSINLSSFNPCAITKRFSLEFYIDGTLFHIGLFLNMIIIFM